MSIREENILSIIYIYIKEQITSEVKHHSSRVYSIIIDLNIKMPFCNFSLRKKQSHYVHVHVF